MKTLRSCMLIALSAAPICLQAMSLFKNATSPLATLSTIKFKQFPIPSTFTTSSWLRPFSTYSCSANNNFCKLSKWRQQGVIYNSIMQSSLALHDPTKIERKLEQYLACRADINWQDDNGQTLLMWIVQSSYRTEYVVRAIAALIKAGAYINTQDNDGMTALMHATTHWSEDVVVVKALLEAKADVTIKNTDNKTAYDFALQSRAHEIIFALKDAAPDTSSQELK